jgi:hypothetical protein
MLLPSEKVVAKSQNQPVPRHRFLGVGYSLTPVVVLVVVDNRRLSPSIIQVEQLPTTIPEPCPRGTTQVPVLAPAEACPDPV